MTGTCAKECYDKCPHQDHRKETCPLRKEDHECHEHEMVLHRIQKNEKDIAEIEERDTERKMILHRLETIETNLKETDFAHKSDIKALELQMRVDLESLETKTNDKMDRLEENIKAEADKREAKNEEDHKEFRKFMLKVMVALAAATGGASLVFQYFI